MQEGPLRPGTLAIVEGPRGCGETVTLLRLGDTGMQPQLVPPWVVRSGHGAEIVVDAWRLRPLSGHTVLRNRAEAVAWAGTRPGDELAGTA
jgi:hypothetical protein